MDRRDGVVPQCPLVHAAKRNEFDRLLLSKFFRDDRWVLHSVEGQRSLLKGNNKLAA